MSPRLPRRDHRGAPVALVITLFAAVGSLACVSSTMPMRKGLRVEVLTPVDGVPISDAGVWLGDGTAVADRRETTMLTLRSDLAAALTALGAEVCEGEGGVQGEHAFDPALAARAAYGDDVDVVVVSELIAYGQVRRSWLWLLFGQGVLAGIGHGLAAAKVTGSVATGWWVGAGELVLETVTWVGGALFASRWIDPVVVRVWAFRTGDGAQLGRWTFEGMRPMGQWPRRRGVAARGARLRAVATRLFAHAAARIAGATGGKAQRSAAAPQPRRARLRLPSPARAR